jgi:O-antigen/teichoic acid export membrane protein
LSYRVVDLATGVLVAAMIAVTGPLTLDAVSDRAQLARRLAHFRRVLVLVGVTVAVGGTALAPTLVRVLAGGHRYASAALPLSLLLAATAFSAVQSTYNTALVALGRGRVLLPMMIGLLATNVVANVLLIPHFGAAGAAAATLATEAASVAAASAWLRREVPLARLPWQQAVYIVAGVLAVSTILVAR